MSARAWSRWILSRLAYRIWDALDRLGCPTFARWLDNFLWK